MIQFFPLKCKSKSPIELVYQSIDVGSPHTQNLLTHPELVRTESNMLT